MGVSGVASASVPAFSSQRMIQPVFTSAALLEIGYYPRVFSAAGGDGIGRLAGGMDDALSSDWGTPVGDVADGSGPAVVEAVAPGRSRT